MEITIDANNLSTVIEGYLMLFNTWLLFLITSAGISFVPGPNSLLVLTHGAMHGTRKTLVTITGGLIGFVLLIGLCMFGIGALLQASEKWLIVLRIVGGLYLVFLGYKLWRSPPITNEAGSHAIVANLQQMFRQGFFLQPPTRRRYFFLGGYSSVHRARSKLADPVRCSCADICFYRVLCRVCLCDCR
ncbi:LysE family translocator [Serratia sp. L9]|uniref:LysE family translocator n=1 Tax=Serratia sp. L9 TaxID=3423946 RepID=UPI003D66BA6D